MFWPGIMGDFMKYLPITLTIGLMASLFVALVFNPAICVVWAGRRPSLARKTTGSSAATGASRRLGLDNPGMTLFLAVALLVGSGHALWQDRQGNRVLPPGRPGTGHHQRAHAPGHEHPRDRPNRAPDRGADQAVQSSGSSTGHRTSARPAASWTSRPAPAGRIWRASPWSSTISWNASGLPWRSSPESAQALADIPGAEIKVEREKDGPPTGAPVTVRIMRQGLQNARTAIASRPNR